MTKIESYQKSKENGSEKEMQFLERLSKLNPSQRKVVDTIEGPLLVVAGPGSGKTEILGMRVAEILRKTHALPSNILCLTFTDSAALNIRERLVSLIGDRAYQVAIHTFHSFCVDIIKKHGEFFYHNATFTPVDPVTQINILEKIIRNMKHDDPLRSYHPANGYVFLPSIKSAITNLKKSGIKSFEFKLILEDNKQALASINETFVPVFDKKITDSTRNEISTLIAGFVQMSSARQKTKELDAIFKTFHPIEESFILSLIEALAKQEEEGKHTILSLWKKKWIVTDDTGKKVFADTLRMKSMDSFANVYEIYQHELFLKGYFDFDDMIIDVISALELEPRLRFELQEQFQYVLVDEFQDTNNAQMRILSLLTSAPEHEGRPNIMVVGDDDQAIYKFQGAELSNILDFRHRYINVGLVTMTENYRSTQGILNVAMNIIRKGSKRLENIMPDLSKELVSRSSADLSKEVIEFAELETILHEYTYVSRKIKELVNNGHSPNEIAVIARTHKSLVDLVPFMRMANVPIKYEKEQNIFAETHIRELITMIRYIASAIPRSKNDNVLDDLLPEILSYAFWNIPRIDIWKLSIDGKSNEMWLSRMRRSANPEIVHIANFFIRLAVDAKSTPLELIIDTLVGAHTPLVCENPDEDQEDSFDNNINSSDDLSSELDNTENEIFKIKTENKQSDTISKKSEESEKSKKLFTSPFKEYYFSKEKFTHSRAEYLTFLSNLRVFIGALRDFNGFDDVSMVEKKIFDSETGEFETNDSQEIDNIDESKINTKKEINLHELKENSAQEHASHIRSQGGIKFKILTVYDLITFVDVYEKNKLSLNDESPFVTARNAVSLMTAHKAKGLEFKTVFVLSCKDSEWAPTNKGQKISFPINLPVMPAGDEEDDKLRLFYVAITRAKEKLYLSSHQVTDKGKQADALRFLVDTLKMEHEVSSDEIERILQTNTNNDEIHTLLETASATYRSASFLDTEQALLNSLLENYKLSVTHLNNYLNIPKGGPRLFFEQNFLRFPQSKSASGAFGTAIHATLEFALNDLKKNRKFVSADIVHDTFKFFLQKEKLGPIDYRNFLEKGNMALDSYLTYAESTFKITDIPELDFAHEHVVIDQEFGVHISGKIDRVSYGDEIEVFDYKTGKSFVDFDNPGSFLKVKAHHYKYQLLFYKLLIESSAFNKKNNYNDKGDKVDLKNKKVTKGTIDFVEPPRHSNKSLKNKITVSISLDEEEFQRLKRLVIIVFKKIKNLEFDIPEEIKEQKFNSDIDAIVAFEEYLLNS